MSEDDIKKVQGIVEIVKGAIRSTPVMTQPRDSWDSPDMLLLTEVLGQFDTALLRESVFIEQALTEARAEQREFAAVIAETYSGGDNRKYIAQAIAAKIRGGSNE